MEQSQYFKQIQEYFTAGGPADLLTRINGSTNPNDRTYRHRTMLTRKYSTNLEWSALSILNKGAIMADVIAMDSSIPLKRRESASKANGEIPKLGTERYKNEKQLTELDILAATQGVESTLFRTQIFDDVAPCLQSIPETLEYMFLQALSTGVTAIADNNNTGTGVRADFGYLPENKFGVSQVWADQSSTPLANIADRIQAKAQRDGNRITTVMLDRTTFNRIAATKEAKDIFSFSIGYGGSVSLSPTFANLNTAVQDRYGYVFDIVERTCVMEKNGQRTALVPWQPGMVVALTGNNVGSLVWGRLAEMSRLIPGINYNTVDDFILLKMFREHRPSFSEHTNTQALAFPVIEGVDQIYTMDSTIVQA